MKNLFPGRLLTVLILLTFLSFSAGAARYYVVIGAFASESNARKYTGYVRNHYLDAYYKFNAARNLYYVHVLESSTKEDARNMTLYIRHETKFTDAWVYTDLAAEETTISGTAVAAQKQPRYDADQLSLDAGPVASTKEYAGDGTLNNLEISKTAAAAAKWTDVEEVSYISGIRNALAVKNAPGVTGKVFTFIAETTDGKTIPTEVMLVNYEKAKKLSSFQTGDYIAFRGKRKNQKLTIVCDVFGYSEAIKTINLDNLKTSGDIKLNKDGVWEVRFKLNRMKTNEISIMYNTVFYKDAAVLEPSSKKQVDELLTLMKEHPGYKILIHSHCNNGSRRVIKFPVDSKGYFDLKNASEKPGNDKQLTRERAQTIHDYLVDNGIDSERIDLLAWGSMDMLVKPNSPDAGINDRIEMELLEVGNR